jgi:L-cystine uptake protein TcyP (sodium:dicarboxylate symporter family)
MNSVVWLNLLLFLFLLYGLFWSKKYSSSLSRQVFIGLLLGLAFGFFLQIIYGENSRTMQDTLVWTNVVGDIYVRLLRMVVMPLILITMIAAVVRMEAVQAVGKIGFSVVFVLIFTTMVAAVIGVVVSLAFGLSAESLSAGARELARADVLPSRLATVDDLSVASVLTNFVPTNIFADLSDSRSNSVIAVVIFAIVVGSAALLLLRENPEQGEPIRRFVEAAQALIMRVVKLVMALTPYGIAALMANVVASSNASDILNLLSFVVASYVALVLMFCVHLLLLWLSGISPRVYLRKMWSTLSFAFATRSSMATIPLTIKAQVEGLRVPTSIASLSASFGATIGQNGCAGIYPAMLAVMAAPTVGVDPTAPMFIVSLISIIAISSFGVAGVGGGATFAALIVLPAMGLPITLVALLISIEPLIDMGRTALNVSGAVVSGVVTSRVIVAPDS